MTVPRLRSLVFALFLAVAGVAIAEQPVNINTASADALAAALTGVGPARAQAIVDYREANGRFADADALVHVPGIGPATVEANRERIVVD